MTPIRIFPTGTVCGALTLDDRVTDTTDSAIYDRESGVMHMTQDRRNALWAAGLVVRGADGREYLTMTFDAKPEDRT